MKSCALFALVACLAGCQPQAEMKVSDRTPAPVIEQKSLDADAFVGTYAVTMIEGSKTIDNDDLPPGQLKYLELKANQTWILRDMMSGFEGSWEMKDGNLVLMPVSGPAGEVKDKTAMVLKPDPDRSYLVITEPKEAAGAMEFSYDPDVIDMINKRMKEQQEKIKSGEMKF